MKRRVTLLFAGVAAVVVTIALFTLPANEDAEFPGYMEADLVLVGSEQGGRVADLSVEEGDHIKQGDPIGRLETAARARRLHLARAAFVAARRADRRR